MRNEAKSSAWFPSQTGQGQSRNGPKAHLNCFQSRKDCRNMVGNSTDVSLNKHIYNSLHHQTVFFEILKNRQFDRE